jgi:hypothetical protein
MTRIETDLLRGLALIEDAVQPKTENSMGIGPISNYDAWKLASPYEEEPEEEKAMGTTVTQDRAFLDAVIPHAMLEDAIDWIAANLDPEDVFSVADLNYWASDNDFVRRDSE